MYTIDFVSPEGRVAKSDFRLAEPNAWATETLLKEGWRMRYVEIRTGRVVREYLSVIDDDEE